MDTKHKEYMLSRGKTQYYISMQLNNVSTVSHYCMCFKYRSKQLEVNVHNVLGTVSKPLKQKMFEKFWLIDVFELLSITTMALPKNALPHNVFLKVIVIATEYCCESTRQMI